MLARTRNRCAVWMAALAIAIPAASALAQNTLRGKIVVANRGSASISVINVRTDQAIDIDLPEGKNPPEPMYVYYTPLRDRFFVGDRANDRVVAYNARTLQMDGMAPTGAGVFHMWGNLRNKQLWVNNDIDNTSTVIDMRTLGVITTVDTPADLVAMGGKPHDVILSPEGDYAYVTVLVPGDNDYVVQYDTSTFQELGSVAVGKDPHVSVTRRNNILYVPCQNTNEIYLLDRDTLATINVLSADGAHGAGMMLSGRYFYATNLPGGGTDALWTLDTRSNQIVGMPVDAPYTVPHNIALVPSGRKIYVTHSGPNDKVSIYSTGFTEPVPVLIGEVTTGMNPFGLAYVP